VLETKNFWDYTRITEGNGFDWKDVFFEQAIVKLPAVIYIRHTNLQSPWNRLDDMSVRARL
jgi:hypothetical protein